MAKDDIDPEDIEEEIDLDADEEIDLEGEIDLEEDFEADSEDGDVDDSEEDVGATVVRKSGEDDEDDDDMLAPDDVEADLDTILKDRLASEDPTEQDEEEVEVEERGSADDALQPKRADEVMCSSCFLLVRKGAPVCPVGDDACPIFKR